MLTNQLFSCCSASLSLPYKEINIEMTDLLFVLCFCYRHPFSVYKTKSSSQAIRTFILFYGIKFCLILE
jgi:hypothetical protein